MIRSIVPALLAVAACSGSEPEEEEEYHPSLEFLAPTDGGSVGAGDVQVSIVVEDFTLESREGVALASPVPLLVLLEGTAWAHNEGGQPRGYCELSLDDSVVGELDTTQFTLTGVTAGSHTLTGRLRYTDGDELDEPVTVTVGFSVE